MGRLRFTFDVVYPGISQKTAHITLKPQAGVSLVSTALGNVAYVCTMDHVPTLLTSKLSEKWMKNTKVDGKWVIYMLCVSESTFF